MQYILLIHNDPALQPPAGSAQEQLQTERYLEAARSLREERLMLGGQALQGVETATCVQVRGGRVQLTDGPFAETKEFLGGYFVVEARDKAHAVELAARLPAVDEGLVEVREMIGFTY